MWEYVCSIKESCLFCVYGFVAWDEDRCFRESICDSKYGIVGVRLGKFYYEVECY